MTQTDTAVTCKQGVELSTGVHPEDDRNEPFIGIPPALLTGEHRTACGAKFQPSPVALNKGRDLSQQVP